MEFLGALRSRADAVRADLEAERRACAELKAEVAGLREETLAAVAEATRHELTADDAQARLRAVEARLAALGDG